MSKYFLLVAVLFLAGCASKSASPVPASQPTAVKASLDVQNSTATPVPEIEVGVVVVDTLNVREGPGVNFPTVGSLNQNEKFYILGETVNSTNNKWLLITLSDNSLGWVTGDQSYVALKKEAVDAETFSTWQKNKEAAQAQLLIPVTSP